MYYVVIDLQQLDTRLRLSSGRTDVDVDRWLEDQGFVRGGGGHFGSADAMNSLSCSEIVFSERRHTWDGPPLRPRRTAAGHDFNAAPPPRPDRAAVDCRA